MAVQQYLLSAAGWLSAYWEALIHEFISEFKIEDIGSEIRHAILPWKEFFTVGGQSFLLTDAIIVTWIAVIPSILLWIWVASKRDRIPSGRQLLGETLVGLFISLCKNNGLNQKQSEQVAPMIGSICFFLVSCNLVSVFGISPPAKNIAFPIALALFTIIYVLFTAIRFVGIKGFWGSLIYPTKIMLPFKIIDYIIKPMSLALRLFGNVFGAFILMEFLHLIIPVVVPGIFGLWFDLADGILQAVIFSYLTALYIGEIVEGAHSAHEQQLAKIQPGA